jgi:hypothetical protein
MAQHKLIFILTRPARGIGGDRYETHIEGEDRPMVIYIPQPISREGGTSAAKELEITIERRM